MKPIPEIVTQDLYNFRFINVKQMIANHGAKLLVGNGCVLTSNVPEYQRVIDKIKSINNLDNLIYQDVYIKECFNVNMGSLDRLNNGDITINFCQPAFQSDIGLWMDWEENAVLWTRFKYDTTANLLRCTYTRDYVKRDFFINDSIVTWDVATKLSKEMQLPLYEKYDFGIVPVFYMQLLPRKIFYGNKNVTTWREDIITIEQLQSLLDHIVETLWKEVEFNRTRVFLNLTPPEVERFNKDIKLAELLNDFIVAINQGAKGDVNARPIDIIQGKPEFEKYIRLVEYIIELMFNTRGYNFRNLNSTTYKSQTEVMVSQSLDQETTRAKKYYYEHDWNMRILRKIFIMYGLDGDPSKWTFYFKENHSIDRLQQLDVLEFKKKNNLISDQRMLHELDQISLDDAKSLFEQIQKEIEYENSIKVEPKDFSKEDVPKIKEKVSEND